MRAANTKNFDFKDSQSLGLQLVKLLAIHDLRGSIELKKSKGTQFRVEFPTLTENEG